MADCGKRESLAAPAWQTRLHFHRQSLRTHHSHQEVQGHKNSRKGFWHDRRYPGRTNGVLSIPASTSHHYTKARLTAILSQLDPARRNVVEFRHISWWNETVYAAFRQTGTIFCSCSGPRLPDELVRTADDVYLSLHGPQRWYRHDYSKDELSKWADRIKPAARRERGFTSITTMKPMRRGTRRRCGDYS